MHLIISLGMILAAAFLFNAAKAAEMASIGLWGYGVGQLFVAPILVFFFLHTLIYFAVRLIRGKDKLKSYTRSRLNYIAAVVSILGILGSAAAPV